MSVDKNLFMDEFCLVTDFGLPILRKHDYKTDEMVSDFQSRRRMVYNAPEVGGSFPVFTKSSDVYAYGIILIEIASRSDPYGVSGNIYQELWWYSLRNGTCNVVTTILFS